MTFRLRKLYSNDDDGGESQQLWYVIGSHLVVRLSYGIELMVAYSQEASVSKNIKFSFQNDLLRMSYSLNFLFIDKLNRSNLHYKESTHVV